MLTPIALQLYTVRELLSKDLLPTLQKITKIGYLGVETYHSKIPTKKLKKHLDETGLEVTSAHSPMPIGDIKNEVLETMGLLGCKHLVSPWTAPENYQTESDIQKMADVFNQACQTANDNGLQFSIHNHSFEFQYVNNLPAYKFLLKYLEPSVLFQIDTYWVKTAGLDPVKVVKELGARAPLLHIKDGPATLDEAMVAVGAGSLEIDSIIQAGKPHTQWHIVELDKCVTDMMTAVEESYTFLTQNGYSRGRF